MSHPPNGATGLDDAVDAIRTEYERRDHRGARTTGATSYESRLSHYRQLLSRAGALPLARKRILDVGCLNGRWLTECCVRWGATPELCAGVDLMPAGLEEWRRQNPSSAIALHCSPCHQLPFESGSMDLVHQSMMFSSITDASLRRRTADEVWRVLAPGGWVLWYDFWINPLNRATTPMRLARVRELFPHARIVARRRITLLPPLTRLLAGRLDRCIPPLEALRLLNTHHLIVLRREGGASKPPRRSATS